MLKRRLVSKIVVEYTRSKNVFMIMLRKTNLINLGKRIEDLGYL